MSRTDFVTYLFYFAVTVTLLWVQVVWGVTLRVYAEPVLNPFYRVYSLTSDTVSRVSGYLRDQRRLMNRVDELRTRNRALRERLYRGLAAHRENRELRRFLDLPEAPRRRMLAAEVIHSNLSGWERTLRINRGSRQGLEPGQVVLDVRNDTWVLRGKIHTVSREHSSVILSSDPRFKIGVTLKPFPERQFVARGWGHRGLKINHFPPFLSVKEPVLVYTAATSVLAPQGLLVGTSGVLHKDDSSPGRVGRRLAVKPFRLEQSISPVWVLVGRD